MLCVPAEPAASFRGCPSPSTTLTIPQRPDHTVPAKHLYTQSQSRNSCFGSRISHKYITGVTSPWEQVLGGFQMSLSQVSAQCYWRAKHHQQRRNLCSHTLETSSRQVCVSVRLGWVMRQGHTDHRKPKSPVPTAGGSCPAHHPLHQGEEGLCRQHALYGDHKEKSSCF